MRQEDTHLKQGHSWKEKKFMWMQKIQVYYLFIGSSLQHITWQCNVNIGDIPVFMAIFLDIF